MPGQICAVAACKSNRLTLKREGVNLIFHTFPKANDLVSSSIRREWKNRCERGDKFNPNTSTICSLHFTPDDYERDLQNELLGLPLRQVLKKTAVPTLNLILGGENPSEKPIERTYHAKGTEKKNKKLMVPLLTKTTLTRLESSHVPSTSSTSDLYEEKYEDLLLKYNQLKSNSYRKMRKLNILLKYYKLKCYKLSINRNKYQINNG